ncbi:cysteine peptidase family C39 domain-containing protein [Novosphingobium aquae]|uniref:Cysteine peptidase family C39 domain-containing protein n=1 Tax=Novosphingobium aquae TaxID=3133435 RepID=A0ABU8S9B6_9SPHN
MPIQAKGIAAQIAAVASAAAVISFMPIAAMAAERPPVARQTRDDDCGAAALASAFALVGVTVTEEQLLRGHAFGRGRGLKASDLVRMATAARTGHALHGTRVLPDHFSQAISEGPAITLIQETDESTGYGFGHFVVVEAYSASRGYLVADPALGERGWIPADELLAKVNTIDIEGRMRALALRLVNDAGEPVGPRAVSVEDEQRYLRLDSLQRTRRALPPGRTAAILSFGMGSAIEPIRAGNRLALVTPQRDIGLQVMTGIGKNREIAVGAVATRTRVELRHQGETALQLGGRTGLSQVSVVASQSFNRKSGGNAQARLGVMLDRSLTPRTILVGASISKPLGNATVSAGLDLRAEAHGGGVELALDPELGLSFDLSRYLSVDLGVAASFASDENRIKPQLSLGMSQCISNHLTINAGYSREFGVHGAHASRFKLELVYVFPNSLRRR